MINWGARMGTPFLVIIIVEKLAGFFKGGVLNQNSSYIAHEIQTRNDLFPQ
jgi:hypothetical protein